MTFKTENWAGPELTAQRAERIAELEELGLEVNVIEPELFGNGVIELKGDIKLSSSERLLPQMRSQWGMFDAIYFCSPNLIEGIKTEKIYVNRAEVGTQKPHMDLEEPGTVEFIILSNESENERDLFTYIMTEEEAEKVVNRFEEEVKKAVESNMNVQKLGAKDGIVANRFIDAAPHHKFKIAPRRHLVVNQSGLLKLNHGAYCLSGIGTKFDSTKHQLWGIMVKSTFSVTYSQIWTRENHPKN